MSANSKLGTLCFQRHGSCKDEDEEKEQKPDLLVGLGLSRLLLVLISFPIMAYVLSRLENRCSLWVKRESVCIKHSWPHGV